MSVGRHILFFIELYNYKTDQSRRLAVGGIKPKAEGGNCLCSLFFGTV